MKKIAHQMRPVFENSARCVLGSIVALFLVSETSSAQNSIETKIPQQKYLTLLGIHSATVAPSGLVFAHLSTSLSLSGDSEEDDSALALGFGLGNANTGLGFQFTAYGNSSTDTFDSFGYFGAKASRRIWASATPVYMSLAIDRIGGWGDASDTDPTATLSFTQFTSLGNPSNGQNFPVMLTLGVGTDVRDLNDEAGVFLGAGIGLTENLGVSTAWNGENFDIGAGFKISGLDNLAFSVSLNDAFDQDDRQRLSLGFTWLFDTSQRR